MDIKANGAVQKGSVILELVVIRPSQRESLHRGCNSSGQMVDSGIACPIKSTMARLE